MLNSSSFNDQYSKVYEGNYCDMVDQMRKQGYNYFTLWVDTDNGHCILQNCNLKDWEDNDSVKISYLWTEGYYELNIDAENEYSSYFVCRQQIQNMYIDKENTNHFLITDYNNKTYEFIFRTEKTC